MSSPATSPNYGPSGRIALLASEDAGEFQKLLDALHAEHQPASDAEVGLIELIAQHFWLMQRAINLQNQLLNAAQMDHRAFSLYLRYQTTNERSYYKAMHELRAVRKEKLQTEIVSEWQKGKQELNVARVRLVHANAAKAELDTDLRGTIEAPLPGHAAIPFADMARAFRIVLRDLNKNLISELNNASDLTNKDAA